MNNNKLIIDNCPNFYKIINFEFFDENKVDDGATQASSNVSLVVSNVDNYGIKRMLPKVIVTAILINLSFIICALAVDITNIIINGLSKNTISYYNNKQQKYLRYCDKLLLDYTPEDIREFLSFYQELNNCSNVSLNNVRRILSTFYEYLHTEEYILKNPMKAVNHIKERRKNSCILPGISGFSSRWRCSSAPSALKTTSGSSPWATASPSPPRAF